MSMDPRARFDGTNFNSWKTRMELILQEKDLWDVVCSEEKPGDADWTRKDRQARATILLNVDDSQLKIINKIHSSSKSAREAWLSAQSDFSDRDTESSKDKFLKKKYDMRIFAERKTQATLQRMQKDFLASINAYALVLVLLATVTYSGFLQPPGGTNNSNGNNSNGTISNDNNSTVVGNMYNNVDTNIFIIFNSSSFYLAVADLLLCVCSSLSPMTSINNFKEEFHAHESAGHAALQSEQITTKQLSQFVASTLFKLICVNVIFTIALMCCVAAYTAAGFVLTGRNHGGKISVVVTSIVGLLFFITFTFWLLRDTWKFLRKALSEKSLSTSLQNRAGSLQVQFRYLNADDPGMRVI